MKYLKYFEQASAYEAYKNGSDYVTPNVSYAKDNNVVYYNPSEAKETSVVCTYNVTDTTNNIRLCANSSNFTSMEIDGVLYNSITSGYTFDTVGKHTVKFELTDPTSISYYAFNSCSSLTSVTIPDSVTSISDRAFYGCVGLTSVTIGNSVVSIGSGAFGSCTSLPIIDDIRYADTYLVEATDKTLATYNIKEGTKFIGANAFKDCSNLTSVTIPDSVTSIGGSAFSGCANLTSIAIPDSVTSIGGSAFYNCSGLTSVTIGNSVTSIGNGAFMNCSNLTSITIPDSVTFIDLSAFNTCSNLTSVTIGNSVTTIGPVAFIGCTSLNEITCLATTPPSISSDTFKAIKENGILKVPTGSDYSSWMSTGDYYLGKYNWTIEYI